MLRVSSQPVGCNDNTEGAEMLSIWNHVKRLSSHLSALASWLLLGWMILLYQWESSGEVRLHAPASKLLTFTGLMVLHTALHLLCPHLQRRSHWHLPYVIVQALLIVAIGVVSYNQYVLALLYVTLLGEAALWLAQTYWVLLILLGMFVLFFFNPLDLLPLQPVTSPLSIRPIILLLIPCVCGYTLLSVQQKRRYERQAMRAQLAQLAAAYAEERLLAAERQRMARELHDTLSQGMVGLVMQLEAIEGHLENEHPEQARAIVHHALLRARSALQDARRAIELLRTDAVARGDLTAVIQEAVEQFKTLTGVPCTLDSTTLPALPASLCEQAFLMVNESLTNVARHANASHAWVQVANTNGTLSMEVRDDGVGFAVAERRFSTGHYGLCGLEERARLLGGKSQITSLPGKGTVVQVCIPLPGQQREELWSK